MRLWSFFLHGSIGTVHHLGPDGNIATTSGWIAMKFAADIPVSQMVYPPDLWLSSNFSSTTAPLSGHNLALVYE